MSPLLSSKPYSQCCCQRLETRGWRQGQGLDVQGWGLENWSSRIMSIPALTPAQSADTDSLLSPRKFSRTWTFEDKDKDLKIDLRGSSRTRTFLEDNNTAYSIESCDILNLLLWWGVWPNVSVVNLVTVSAHMTVSMAIFSMNYS